MDLYCSKCGNSISNSLYCGKCGELTSNLPTSFSNEESLAGLVVSTISKNNYVKFSEFTKLEASKEKIFRIFAQLERTGNYFIEQDDLDFVLKSIQESVITISKDKNLLKNLDLATPLVANDFNILFH